MDIISLVEKNLCVKDIDDFREALGVDLLKSIDKLRKDDDLDTTILTGLIWIAKRHEEPTFTLEEARTYPIFDLMESAQARPTKAAPKKSGKKTSKRS